MEPKFQGSQGRRWQEKHKWEWKCWMRNWDGSLEENIHVGVTTRKWRHIAGRRDMKIWPQSCGVPIYFGLKTINNPKTQPPLHDNHICCQNVNTIISTYEVSIPQNQKYNCSLKHTFSSKWRSFRYICTYFYPK